MEHAATERAGEVVAVVAQRDAIEIRRAHGRPRVVDHDDFAVDEELVDARDAGVLRMRVRTPKREHADPRVRDECVLGESSILPPTICGKIRILIDDNENLERRHAT